MTEKTPKSKSLDAFNVHAFSLPLTKEDLATVTAGDKVLLSGALYTLRDAGHMRLLELFKKGEDAPVSLEGETIFYAGPTPAKQGHAIGSVGPTTASRMDFAAKELHRRGVVATIGKGQRSDDIVLACKETASVYFAAVGGAAAFLASHVTESTVVAWEDLGAEALTRIVVKDFPVFVAIDTMGNDLYAAVIQDGKSMADARSNKHNSAATPGDMCE